MTSQRHAHCSYCGQAYAPAQPWPRRCAACGNISYLNPVPVAVVVVPIGAEGVLLVRRDIEPRRGWLALPGGYIDAAETWQEAGAREVYEETGLRLDPAAIREFRVRSTRDGALLVFGLASPIFPEALPAFTPNAETQALVVAREPVELAFPLHTEALRDYFALGNRP